MRKSFVLWLILYLVRMKEMKVLRIHASRVKIERNARKVNIVYSLYAHILFDCFIVSGLSDTTKRRHRGRNKGLDVERFIIENLGKKLSVTFNEGKTYKAISHTYANFNDHIGSCVRDLMDLSLPR